MTIKEALSKFDTIDKKGFYMHDVEGALSAVEECEKNNPEYEYEMLAFGYSPNMQIIHGGIFTMVIGSLFQMKMGTLFIYRHSLK